MGCVGTHLKTLGGNLVWLLGELCENPYVREFERSFDLKDD
jgi:hypothetical protein